MTSIEVLSIINILFIIQIYFKYREIIQEIICGCNAFHRLLLLLLLGWFVIILYQVTQVYDQTNYKAHIQYTIEF